MKLLFVLVLVCLFALAIAHPGQGGQGIFKLAADVHTICLGGRGGQRGQQQGGRGGQDKFVWEFKLVLESVKLYKAKYICLITVF